MHILGLDHFRLVMVVITDQVKRAIRSDFDLSFRATAAWRHLRLPDDKRSIERWDEDTDDEDE